MPTPSERTRNNVRAGVFVTISLVLALVVVAALTSFWDNISERSHRYAVTFDVSSGVRNLKRGAPVRVGGLQMGAVTGVEKILNGDQPFRQIKVDFKLDRDIRLYHNAVIAVAAPLIGSEAWLDVSSVGGPGVAGPDGSAVAVNDAEVSPGDTITGVSASGMLASFIGPEAADDTRRFIDFLGDVRGKYDADLQPILKNANRLTTHAANVAERIEQKDWPAWALSVNDIFAWANNASVRIDDVIDEGRNLFIDTRSGVNEARATLRDNRPRIDSTIQHLESTMISADKAVETINEETLVRLNRLFNTGQNALQATGDLIERASREFEPWAVDLGQTLANSRLASQQLSLAAMELRRSPWKVLYVPKQYEVEHENLYGAARSFSLAASDLRAAAESVQRLMDNHPDALASDPQTLNRLKQYLTDRLGNYQKAQDYLVQTLLKEKPVSRPADSPSP